MSWVSIDQDLCNACGICALRCTRCFTKVGKTVTVDAGVDNCNLCGHCVALCPTDAIHHSQMDMANFPRYERKASFDTDKFVQFVRERRSHRLFRDKPIPHRDLELLVEVCRYAPTGSNVQTVELLVLEDKEKIKRYSDLAVEYFLNQGEPVRRRLAELEAQGSQGTPEHGVVKNMLDRVERFALAKKAGIDPILHKAPAVLIFHSIPVTSTPKDNAVIASTTAALAARTMGLEACYIGLLEIAANNYPPLLEAMGLPEGNRIFSVLVLGYPRLKFLRAVDRKPIKTRWQ